MASDFNEKRPGRTPSTSYTSSSLGGFSGRPAGREGDRVGGSSSRPFGFRNRPRPSRQSFEHEPPPQDGSTHSSRSRPVRHPAVRRGAQHRVEAMPWNIVIPLLIAVALVVLCVVFRESIIQFLSQLLSYIVIIAILIFILKSFLFGGGRR